MTVVLALGLPTLFEIVIFFDSKKRLGKISWPWIAGGLLAVFVGFTRGVTPYLANAVSVMDLGGAIGVTIGLWLESFYLYRTMTKGAAKKYKGELLPKIAEEEKRSAAMLALREKEK